MLTSRNLYQFTILGLLEPDRVPLRNHAITLALPHALGMSLGRALTEYWGLRWLTSAGVVVGLRLQCTQARDAQHQVMMNHGKITWAAKSRW